MMQVLVLVCLLSAACTVADESYERYLPPCRPGQVQRGDGQCVTPTINRRYFLYQSPEHKRPASHVTVYPNPNKDYNYVFVRSPEVRVRNRVVIGPPKQQTLVYLLSKENQVLNREVVELPAVNETPELYHISYSNPNDNLDLPGGIDLQTALAQKTTVGTIIEGSSSRAGPALYAKVDDLVNVVQSQLPDKTITGATYSEASGQENFQRAPEEDLTYTEAEAVVAAAEVTKTEGNQQVQIFEDVAAAAEADSSVDSTVSSEAKNTGVAITFPVDTGVKDDDIPDLSYSIGKSQYDVSDGDSANYERSETIDSTSSSDSSQELSSDSESETFSNVVSIGGSSSDTSFGPEGVILVVDNSNFDGTGQTTFISTGAQSIGQITGISDLSAYGINVADLQNLLINSGSAQSVSSASGAALNAASNNAINFNIGTTGGFTNDASSQTSQVTDDSNAINFGSATDFGVNSASANFAGDAITFADTAGVGPSPNIQTGTAGGIGFEGGDDLSQTDVTGSTGFGSSFTDFSTGGVNFVEESTGAGAGSGTISSNINNFGSGVSSFSLRSLGGENVEKSVSKSLSAETTLSSATSSFTGKSLSSTSESTSSSANSVSNAESVFVSTGISPTFSIVKTAGSTGKSLSSSANSQSSTSEGSTNFRVVSAGGNAAQARFSLTSLISNEEDDEDNNSISVADVSFKPVNLNTGATLAQLISGSGIINSGRSLGADALVNHIPVRITKV